MEEQRREGGRDEREPRKGRGRLVELPMALNQLAPVPGSLWN